MKKDGIAPNQGYHSSENKAAMQNIIGTMSEIPVIISSAGSGVDYAIDDALAKIGKLFSASRGYVMLDEKDGRYLRNIHEWVNSESGPSMFSWPLYDYDFDIPSLKILLEDNDFVHGNVGDMPQDLQKVLSKQGITTIFVAPMLRDGVRIGLVGMDFCGTECEWHEEHGIILRFFASLICLALERKQYQIMRGKLSAIRKTMADVEPLLAVHAEDESSERPQKPVTLLDAERRIIIETLELYHGNKLKTAKHLGLTWPSLDRRCKKLGIEVKRK